MSALRGKPVDRLPWILLFVLYTMVETLAEVPQYTPDALEYFRADIYARHVNVVIAREIFREGAFIRPVYEFEDGDMITGYSTPIGKSYAGKDLYRRLPICR